MQVRPTTPDALAESLAGQLADRVPEGRWLPRRGRRRQRRRPGRARGRARRADQGRRTRRAARFRDGLPAPGLDPLRARPPRRRRLLLDVARRRRSHPRRSSTPSARTAPAASCRACGTRHATCATRAGYVDLPPGGILVLDGPVLLGRGLPLDFTVHLSLSDGALRRRTPEDEHWTLPAYRRYAEECLPEDSADVVVRWDDPRRPAVVAAN
ncbi:uridine kinase [Yinghuangia aomiensis]